MLLAVEEAFFKFLSDNPPRISEIALRPLK
jgi:hypothetical protein